MTDPGDRCFAVPAYGEPPHLEACLQSLEARPTKAPVTVATSIPNSHLQELARRFRVPVDVGPQAAGIGSDWNFAMQAAEASWVTLAHQDDFCLPTFTNVASDRFAYQNNQGPLEQ